MANQKSRRIQKARYWWGVLYPENMVDQWQDQIGDILQVPYCYCMHDHDTDQKSEHRKDHIHLILAFPNTTTYKHAYSIFSLLSADGKSAINKCEAVIGIRRCYDYLIHDTDECRKKEKTLYPAAVRISGNNFDIGAYEQLGIAEKDEICKQIAQDIRTYCISNFLDLYEYVVDTYDDTNYFELLRTYSSFFERLTRGNFQRYEQGRSRTELKADQERVSRILEDIKESDKTIVYVHEILPEAHEKHTEAHEKHTEARTNLLVKCCLFCGSSSLRKCGKTPRGLQRYVCKDCGKSFSF